MRGYRDVVCFAGCHGKSSTTGIATHIALEAALDPSVMIGAELPVIGGNYRIGAGSYFSRRRASTAIRSCTSRRRSPC